MAYFDHNCGNIILFESISPLILPKQMNSNAQSIGYLEPFYYVSYFECMCWKGPAGIVDILIESNLQYPQDVINALSNRFLRKKLINKLEENDLDATIDDIENAINIMKKELSSLFMRIA